MADLGRVINRLNNEITHNEYWDEEYADCIPVSLLKDAMELLKALEPKSVKDMLVVGSHLMGKCPKCYKVLTVQDHPVACGFCGQKVKWK